jgi:hypothetical protein
VSRLARLDMAYRPRSMKFERSTIPIAEICGAILVNPASLKTMPSKAVYPRAESPKGVVTERGLMPWTVSPLIEATAHSSVFEGRLPTLVT